jgi:hypothetical protein
VTGGRLRVAFFVALCCAVLTPAAAIGFDAAHHKSLTLAPAGAVAPLPAAPRPADRPGQPPERAQPVVPQPAAADSDGPPTGIAAALDAQRAALLRGDLNGFLAPVAPDNAALRAALTRRFNALRALHVAVWREAVGEPTRNADGGWSVPIRVTYCFVVPDCAPLSVSIPTAWAESAGAARLIAFGDSAAADLGPRPWEESDLRAAVGRRVMVASTARYAARLPALLAAAERAAAVTDRFARWGKPPGRYVVYLAGPGEWGKWYGVPQQSWVAAFAMPVTDVATEVVLNIDHVDARDVTDVLRHEFTHVVTLAGVDRTYPHSWWLVEGIAEYVRVAGGPRPFDGFGDVRKLVHNGLWAGDVALDGPPPTATAGDVNGRYGVAYLAVKRLADRYGEAKMLAFFGAVVRDGEPLDKAARSVFGAPWGTVSADCAAAVSATAAEK